MKKLITAIMVLSLVLFSGSMLAGGGKSHKSDKSAKSHKSGKSHKSHKSGKSDKSRKSKKSGKSGKSDDNEGSVCHIINPESQRSVTLFFADLTDAEIAEHLDHVADQLDELGDCPPP